MGNVLRPGRELADVPSELRGQDLIVLLAASVSGVLATERLYSAVGRIVHACKDEGTCLGP
jgi:hypothetical protein